MPPNGQGAQLRAAREREGYIRRAAGESTASPAARRLGSPAGRAAAARQLQRLVGQRETRWIGGGNAVQWPLRQSRCAEGIRRERGWRRARTGKTQCAGGASECEYEPRPKRSGEVRGDVRQRNRAQ